MRQRRFVLSAEVYNTGAITTKYKGVDRMILEFIFRWAHVLFGIVWIGMLYYFNFVQTEYFKEA